MTLQFLFFFCSPFHAVDKWCGALAGTTPGCSVVKPWDVDNRYYEIVRNAMVTRSSMVSHDDAMTHTTPSPEHARGHRCAPAPHFTWTNSTHQKRRLVAIVAFDTKSDRPHVLDDAFPVDGCVHLFSRCLTCILRRGERTRRVSETTRCCFIFVHAATMQSIASWTQV